MLPKYQQFLEHFTQLEADLQDPAIVGNAQKLKTISQEYSDNKEWQES
jgi:protein subunit release factor A